MHEDVGVEHEQGRLSVRLARRPAPMLVYSERLLRELRWSHAMSQQTALTLVAWDQHDDLQWRRLDIVSTNRGGPLDVQGTVEFKAWFRHGS